MKRERLSVSLSSKNNKDYLAVNLPKNLLAEGVVFKSFTLSSQGKFLGKDVDWNFKDFLHPKLVHKQLDQTHIYTTDFTTTQIFFQKILFFRIPFQVIQYDTGPNSLCYCFSFFNFIVCIETSYETRNQNTKVKTKYNIGSLNKLLLNLAFPLLKIVFTKNYRILMSEDMPLRLRKGQLRSWGFTFKTDTKEKISYHDCNKITTKNINFINKKTEDISKKIKYVYKENKICSFYIGRSDNFGLRGELRDNKVFVFPRICNHEGACLDNTDLKGGLISCPWHGKKFKPIFIHDLISGHSFNFIYSKKNYLLKFYMSKGYEKINVSIS